MRVSILILSVLVPGPVAAHVVRYEIDARHSDVTAQVGVFGFSSRTAHFPTLHGGIAFDSAQAHAMDVDVEIDARALVAPDPATLARLKGPRFFDVAHFPTIRFAGHDLVLTSERSGTVAGELTARGVSRPATLAVQFDQPPRGTAAVTANQLVATATIDRRDFGMTAYSLFVGHTVTIRIAARVVVTP